MEQSVPKRRHIKFRRRGITQKKANDIQGTSEVEIRIIYFLLVGLRNKSMYISP